MSKLKARKPEEVKPGHVKGLLFGKSGVGKTWFALNFPAPYFIDTEGGASGGQYMAKLKSAGGGYMGPDDGACDFEEILDQVKALTTEKHEYKTLVIDSVTKVFQMAIANEAERLGDKDAFGASKKPAVSSMRRLLSWIMRVDMNCWFVAHEVAEWAVVGKERKEVGRVPDVWDKLVYELDLSLQVEHPGPGQRIATVRKSRLIGFPEYSRFPLQENDHDLGYQEFSARYGRVYIEAEAKAQVLATPEQVQEIKRLLAIIKIDQNDIDKMLARNNAESFAELTTEQAQKFIDWMRQKVTPPDSDTPEKKEKK